MLRRQNSINRRSYLPLFDHSEKGESRTIEEEEKKYNWRYRLRAFLTRMPFISSFRILKDKRTTMTSLDDGLLTEIHKHLPNVDKMCLSLTCKRFFNLLGTVANHVDFKFPRLLYVRVPILCVNSKDLPRNQLLVRLEDQRWAYCGDCLKLHPRKEFTKNSLRSEALERRCSPFAGIVDLCPCNSLTLRQRNHIIDLLDSPATQPGMKYCTFDFERAEGPRMVHSCSFKFRSGCILQFSTHLEFKPSEHPANLVANSQFLIWFSAADSSLPAKPIFACPHQDLLPLIRQDRISEFCPKCCTLILRKPRQAGTAGPEILSTNRVLGDSRHPADRVCFREAVWQEGYRATRYRLLSNLEHW